VTCGHFLLVLGGMSGDIRRTFNACWYSKVSGWRKTRKQRMWYTGTQRNLKLDRTLLRDLADDARALEAIHEALEDLILELKVEQRVQMLPHMA
jgi:hypothetical protein